MEKILETFPTLTNADVRSTSMGAQGVDVQLSTQAQKLFPYSVECKSRAAVGVYAYFEQAQQNAGEYIPLLVVKQNQSKPLVILDMDDFFRMLNENSKGN